MKKLLIVVSVLALGGCATVEVAKPTTSGNAERVFVGATKEQVKLAMATRCIEKGNTVVESSDFSLSCSIIDSSFGMAVAQMLITGNNNPVPVTNTVVYNFIETKEGVKIFATAKREMTNPNGTKQVSPIKSNEVTNTLQAVLDSIELTK